MTKLKKIPLQRLEEIKPGLNLLVDDNCDIVESINKGPKKGEKVQLPISVGKAHINSEIEKLLNNVDESQKPGLLFILNETEILSYPDDCSFLKEARLPLWIIKHDIWFEIFKLECQINRIIYNKRYAYIPVNKTTIKVIKSPQ